DPSTDKQRTGYNLDQARIAVGSGQITGKGLFTGTQTNLDFVPEVQTDFIFTAVGEELGFVGSAVLLGLFAIFLWRGLRIAMLSKDLFGTLLAAGVVAMLAFQMFINIGMTIGVSPITGIPLAFVSYGGSSMVTTYIATGLLLNVHMRRLSSEALERRKDSGKRNRDERGARDAGGKAGRRRIAEQRRRDQHGSTSIGGR